MGIRIQKAGDRIVQEGLGYLYREDLFNEVLVKRYWTAREYGLATGIMLLAGILLMLGFVLLHYILPVVFVLLFALLYVVYFAFLSLQCEYEYIATNGALDVDLIVAKRKRKRQVSVNTEQLEVFGRWTPEQQARYAKSNLRRLDFCSHQKGKAVLFLVASTKKGRALILIDAEEKIEQNLRRFQPSKETM